MCKNIRDVIANCPAILLPTDYPFYTSPRKLLIFFPSLTEMILFQTLVLLLFSHANTLLITQNVAFQKVNEITTTHSRWLVTFIIDLEPYEHFINKIEDDFVKTDKAVSTMSAVQDKSASHASMCHFVILQKNLLKKKKKPNSFFKMSLSDTSEVRQNVVNYELP